MLRCTYICRHATGCAQGWKLVADIGEPLSADQTHQFTRALLNDEQWEAFQDKGDRFFPVHSRVHRFRVNAYKQRGSCSLAIRLVNLRFPILRAGIAPGGAGICQQEKRFGVGDRPTGSGKSTTLAAIVNKINMERAAHIITLEEPIEYLHRHQKSIVNQRKWEAIPEALRRV